MLPAECDPLHQRLLEIEARPDQPVSTAPTAVLSRWAALGLVEQGQARQPGFNEGATGVSLVMDGIVGEGGWPAGSSASDGRTPVSQNN